MVVDGQKRLKGFVAKGVVLIRLPKLTGLGRTKREAGTQAKMGVEIHAVCGGLMVAGCTLGAWRTKNQGWW